MNTTKSLPILAVALVATLATATAVPADDTLILPSHQTESMQADSAIVRFIGDRSKHGYRSDRRACRDGSCGVADSCSDGTCCGPAGGRLQGCHADGAGCGRLHGCHAGGAGSHGLLAQAHYAMYSCLHSGQPLIDPYAQADWIAQLRAARRSWHAGYYNTEWGAPVALMVAPTARMQTRWSWGVGQSTMSPIYAQYKRPYPGPVGGGMGVGAGPLLPTPRWPSHTDQFGIYYVRGPW